MYLSTIGGDGLDQMFLGLGFGLLLDGVHGRQKQSSGRLVVHYAEQKRSVHNHFKGWFFVTV